MQDLGTHNFNLSTNMSHYESPFFLTAESEQSYRRWRAWKLAVYPTRAEELLVQLDNPFHMTEQEKAKIMTCFLHANMVIYTINKDAADLSDKKIVQLLGQQLGLNRLDSNLCADSDSITSLQVIEGGRKQGYIPYSNMKLSWHTDGYYNKPNEQIRGVILHCVSNAAEGGENALLDHEMLYIHLRDLDPAYISALMEEDVMTIPANVENGVEIRGAQSGPVFSVDPLSGALHMRYSARKRNIIWKDDEITMAAVNEIDRFLDSDSPWILRHRLEPGQGLICNNVLHNRTAFKDGDDVHKRLIYRGRYFDRLDNTSFHDVIMAMS